MMVCRMGTNTKDLRQWYHSYHQERYEGIIVIIIFIAQNHNRCLFYYLTISRKMPVLVVDQLLCFIHQSKRRSTLASDDVNNN
jgi:hypothetical protein